MLVFGREKFKIISFWGSFLRAYGGISYIPMHGHFSPRAVLPPFTTRGTKRTQTIALH